MNFVIKKRRRKKLIKNLLTTITLITNIFIISGVSRHWYNIDNKQEQPHPFIPVGTHDS